MQKNEHVPPISNRGVQTTGRNTLRPLIDWLQVTFKTVTDETEVFDLLNVEKCKCVLMPNGLYGYKTHYKFGNISILYDGQAGTGIHVQMTGQGCREFEQFNDWHQFILLSLTKNARFTRIDIAVDEIRYDNDKPFFKIGTLVRKVKDDAVRSQFRKARHMETIMINGGQSQGHTIYFGQPTSEIQIRFYEKNFEREAAGKNIEENITIWNRTEVQTRNDRAQAIAYYLINNDNLGKIVTGILSYYITFCIKGISDNKSKWETCKWWLDFLGEVEPLKLTLIAPDRTIEKTKTWVEKQVSKSLAMLVLAEGTDDFIKKMIVEATDKLSDTEIQLAIDYATQKKEEKEYIEYLKNNAYDRYLFKIGQHVKGIKKDAIDEIAPNKKE